jgi:hypothetical protein
MVIFAVFRYKVTDFLEDNGWFGLFFVSSVVCPLDNAHAEHTQKRARLLVPSEY